MLSIEYRDLLQLKPRDRNPRTHSPQQIDQIAHSIERFGFTNPVLIDDLDGIIAGHGRADAARQLGMTEVPTVRLSHMSEAEIRAYVIADNRLAENAGWDRELLGLELGELADLNLDFELTITGFEAPEIDILIQDIHPADPSGDTPDPADMMPEVQTGPAVTRPGDVWRIGRHRIVCGSALDAEPYAKVLDGAHARMIFTDPPYNVPIAGHVSGLGRQQHREFAMAVGEMTPDDFTAFLGTAFGQMARHSCAGSLHFICMDWRHMGEILAAGDATYAELKALCVWAKTNGGMGSLYRSQHELVFVFKHGAKPHINNVELGRHGRNRTNVWTYAGANSFGEEREDLALHPTVKPVDLVADAILDCSNRGDLILDPFAGSGSTLIAAERTGRRCAAIELDPLYCDTIIRRARKVCGLQAALEATGAQFEEVATTRLATTETEPQDSVGVSA